MEAKAGLSPASTLILNFPASQTVRNEVLFFINYLVSGGAL